MLLQEGLNELQNSSGGSGARRMILINGAGSAVVVNEPNGTIFYSVVQDPNQISLDTNSISPAIGSEYIICTGSNDGVILISEKTDGRLQISGTATNTFNEAVYMDVNSKCTVTKLTSTLWIVQGDSLSYYS